MVGNKIDDFIGVFAGINDDCFLLLIRENITVFLIGSGNEAVDLHLRCFVGFDVCTVNDHITFQASRILAFG